MEKILVETSARHVHLTTEDLEKLFGRELLSHSKRISVSPVSLLARKE